MQSKRFSMISWEAVLAMHLGVFSGRCVEVDAQPGEPFQFVCGRPASLDNRSEGE